MPPKRSQKSRKGRTRDNYFSRPPQEPKVTNTELLEDIKDTLLHILRNSACMLCRGVGLMVVGKKDDGKPDLTVCICRRLSLEFLAEFGMGFNPDGSPQDGSPEDGPEPKEADDDYDRDPRDAAE